MKLVNRLMLIAGGGLVGCVTIAVLFRKEVSRQIHKTIVFQEAMDKLRENRGAKFLLGQPITDSLAKYSGPGLLFRDHSEISVEVSGPKSKGILFIKAKPDNEKMRLDTVQLQVGMDATKRLVIKKSDEISNVS